MTPRAVAPVDPNAAIAESLPALLMGVDWQNVLDAGTRAVLERQALRPYLQRQRWFASKTRDIRMVRFTDWAPLRSGSLVLYPSDELREQALNATLVESAHGLRIAKERASKKIDSLVALAMACTAAVAEPQLAPAQLW